MLHRSRIIKIGGFDRVEPVFVGGGYPVVIQTMWKDRLSFADLLPAAKEPAARIEALKRLGCGLIRFSVPDMEAAEVLGALAATVSMPLVADIHFDYKIALRCLDFPIAKIRINPGNIGSKDRLEKVLSKAAAKGVPIRIGVNAGSLPTDLRDAVDTGAMSRAEALVSAAERELAVFNEFHFDQVLVSMKASSAAETVAANRLLSERLACRENGPPLHVGVTEAGPLIPGVVRNTLALHTLLCEGIGDTIRVSLSDSMESEVIAGREILNSARDSGADRCPPGVTVISCPRCGRNGFDTHDFTRRWQDVLYSIEKNCTIAIMGCIVNGPGEGRHADLGICGAGNKVQLFRHGKVIRTIDASYADSAFREELNRLLADI